MNRNIVVAGHRTSVRLEPGMWTALRDLCLREGLSIHQFCTLVDRHRGESGLTAGIRVALPSYFRTGELPGERRGKRVAQPIALAE